MDALTATDPTTVGPYRLLGRLGEGTRGLVYLAQSSEGRQVAVKVFHQAFEADGADLAQIVEKARSVTNPYVAAVVDAELAGEHPWIATEYVRARSLAEVVAQHGQLSFGMVHTMAAGLTKALAALHGAGLVHGNIKPTNVLMAADGPRLVDIALTPVRVPDDEEVPPAQRAAALVFVSPEQMTGAIADGASDVFGLGAVLVFAGSGDGPFGSGSASSITHRAANAEPYLPVGVTGPLRDVIASCLVRDPAQRPIAAAVVAGVPPLVTSAFVPPDWLPPLRTEPAWTAPIPGRFGPTPRHLMNQTAEHRIVDVPVDVTPTGRAPDQPSGRWSRRGVLIGVFVLVIAVVVGLALILRPGSSDPAGAAPIDSRTTSTAPSTTNPAPTTPAAPTSTAPAPSASVMPAVVTAFSIADNNGTAGLNKRLAFTVTPPAGGAAIIRYEFDYTGDGARDYYSAYQAGFITGLTNGIDYVVRVRACNDLCGPWSAPSPPRRPYGPIKAMTITGSATGLDVSFTYVFHGNNGRDVVKLEKRRDGGSWQDLGAPANGSDTWSLGGPSQTATLELRLTDSAGQTVVSSATATTAPSTLVVSAGANKSSCGVACRYIRIHLINFAPGSHSCSLSGSPGSVMGSPVNVLVGADGDKDTSTSAYYSTANGVVTANCDGIADQSASWPAS